LIFSQVTLHHIAYRHDKYDATVALNMLPIDCSSPQNQHALKHAGKIVQLTKGPKPIYCEFVVQHAVQRVVWQIHNKLKVSSKSTTSRTTQVRIKPKAYNKSAASQLVKMLYDLLSNKSTTNQS